MMFKRLLTFLIAGFAAAASADCVFFTQRPTVYEEYTQLLAEGQRQASDRKLSVLSMLNMDSRASLSGAWNLGVFSVTSSSMRQPAALKLSSAEYLDFKPEFRQTARLKHYVAVHKVLGDLAVAPPLLAILTPEAVNKVLHRRPFQNALYGKYGSTLKEAIGNSGWLGIVMGLLFDPHPLSRAAETPPFFKLWCEPHISRALSEMAEIRRRVMIAGINLFDQQLVITPDAHVYLIDIDGYTFDDIIPDKTDFSTEATTLLERWQVTKGQTYSPALRKKYFTDLVARHPVCAEPITGPWPDWRDHSVIDCSSDCKDQLSR